MTWTKEQRTMAAADLFERSSMAHREGRHEDAMKISERGTKLVTGITNPASHYGNGLFYARSTKDNADLAIASILRGEQPADSLPGRVEAYRNKAQREANATSNYNRLSICEGEVKALANVMEILGCKVYRPAGGEGERR